MTIEGLRQLDTQEKRRVFEAFWFAYSAAPADSKERRCYRGYLDQLRSIFSLDMETWMQWTADSATRLLAVELLLDDVLRQAA